MENTKDQNTEPTLKNGVVETERILNAPVQQVWAALTDKKKMKEWYFDVPDFKPEVGTEFSFEGGPEGRTYKHVCKVIEVVPERRIVYTWQYAGYTGSSTLSFDLFPEGQKTRLKLRHEGLDTFPSDNTDFNPNNFVGGWNHFMNAGLPEYLTKNQ